MQALNKLEEEAQNPLTPLARLSDLMAITIDLDRSIAKNPTLSPQLISQLLDRKQPGVELNLASNPNTPLTTLLRLGQTHPDEFLHNPSLDLFFVEDPGLLEKFSTHLLDAILARPLPLWLQMLLLRRPSASVRCQLAQSTKLAQEVLAFLAKDQQSFVRAEVAANQSTPAFILAQFANDPSKVVRRRLMENGATPSEALCEMLRSDPGLLRVSRNIAKHPNIRKAILLIVEREKPEILRGNPSFLHKLSNDALSAVLTFFETPDWMLWSLSTHTNEFVRRQVGVHPNTPSETLEILASDPNEHTRQGVARNPKTLGSALLRLSKDSVERIRGAVAENPGTPPKTLGALAIDPCASVRGRAGQNPNLFIEMIEYLARDRDDFVREHVAKNPNTPAVLLQKLCRDSSLPVAKAATLEARRRDRR
jgi:hypothetical protein